MMVKKRGFAIIIAFVLILSSLNLFMFFNNGFLSYSTLSGMFVKEINIGNINFNIPFEIPFEMNLSLLIFILQWLVLLLILIIAYRGFLKHKKHEVLTVDYHEIRKKKTRSETDLDIFYDLLKNKKSLSTKTIAKLFGISKEKALEWGKILENHELAVIEYPTFNDPEIKIKEEKHEEEVKAEEAGGKETGEKGKQKELEFRRPGERDRKEDGKPGSTTNWQKLSEFQKPKQKEFGFEKPGKKHERKKGKTRRAITKHQKFSQLQKPKPKKGKGKTSNIKGKKK